MRKNFGGKIVKRAVIAATAVMLTTNTPMIALAEEVDTYDASEKESCAPSNTHNDKGENTDTKGESRVDSNDDKYTNVESSGSEDAKKIQENAKEAQEAAQEAEDAAEDAVKEVEKIISEVEDANNSAETANKKVAEIEEEAKAITTNLDDVEQKQEELKKSVDAYNSDITTGEAAINSAISKEDLKALDEAVNGTAEENTLIDKLEEQKENALSALETALETDQEERKKAAEDAKVAAEAAEQIYKEAEEVCNKTSQSLDNAIKEYNTKAIIYGQPLYGETSVTYNIHNTEESITVNGLTPEEILSAKLAAQSIINSEKEIKDAYDAIQGLDLANSENAIAKAKEDYIEAKEQYSEAKEKAEDAALRAEEAYNKAIEASATVSEKVEDTVNYYVNKTNDALEQNKTEIAAKEQEISTAKDKVTEKESDYQAIEESAKNKAIEKYNENLQQKEKAMQEALEEYNKAKYNFIYELKYKKAKNEYDNYNKESVKQDAIESELKATIQYQELTQARNSLSELESELVQLKETKSKKEAEMAEKQAAVEQAKNEYLDSLEQANKEVRDATIAVIKNQIYGYSSDINQIEFDNALNDWANQVNWNTALGWMNLLDKNAQDEFNDAKQLRIDMGAVYGDEGLKNLLNEMGITQALISTKEIDAEMAARIQEIRGKLQIAEEKKANVEAKIAELEAEAANKSITTALDDNKEIITVTEENDKKHIEVVGMKEINSSELIEKAEGTLTTAKENLEQIKKEVTSYKLEEINFAELLNKIAVAEKAVKNAEEVLQNAKKIVADAQRYSEYAGKYAAYVDGVTQKGTGYVRIEKDEEGNIIRLDKQDNFDLTNIGTVSRPTDYFEIISGKKQLDVPEVIYKEYLKAIVAHERDSKVGIKDEAGAGISTGETLPFYYWEIKDNMLTGKYYESTTDLVNGEYFVAYSFKKESDSAKVGYHFDGVIVNYTSPKEEPVTPSPDKKEDRKNDKKEDKKNNKSSDNNTSPANTTTTIDEEGTPLAATPSLTTITDTDVPLSSTVQIIDDEAVPMSDSVMKTGDTSIPMLPFVYGGTTAIGAAFLVSTLKKKKKQDK